MTDSDDLRNKARTTILDLALERGQTKTLCPSEATRALAAAMGEDDWQRYSPLIREVASDMIRQGDIVMRKKGEITPPEQMKGAFRLGLPPSD